MKKRLEIISLFVLFLFVTYKPAFANETRFYELDPNADWQEKITTYREILKEKYLQNIYFTEDEVALFKKNGYILNEYWISTYNEANNLTSDYYFPVIFTWNNTPYLVYTSSFGYTYQCKLDDVYICKPLGFLHGPLEKPADSITVTNTESYLVLFSPSEASFTAYQYGEPVQICKVPENSIYCGYSLWEGYIVRSGTDVYAVDLFDMQDYAVCIAHDVNYVINSNFFYSVERWSQPLLLMNNGTLKVYISSKIIKELFDTEADDPCFLFDPLVE